MHSMTCMRSCGTGDRVVPRVTYTLIISRTDLPEGIMGKTCSW